MNIRFLADASLHSKVAAGLRRREPSIDFQEAQDVIADGTPDPEVLAVAADEGRVLVTTDVRTMGGHLRRFVETRESPGVIQIPSTRSIGEAIEGLLLVWLFLDPDGLRNRVTWLP